MNLRIDPARDGFTWYMVGASAFLHLLIFLICAALLNISFNTASSPSGYIQMSAAFVDKQLSAAEKQIPVQEEAVPEPKPDKSSASERAVENITEQAAATGIEEDTSAGKTANMTFNNTNTDTSSLNNVYSEKTLNVSIKYPAGWAYMDQNRKNKLDGVTFMAAAGTIKPPPYVHLAVQTKDMFIESRYKYNIKTWNYTAYYNDPEEMAGQVSQIFYIRTETDEDYSIKFIMQGIDNFKVFQPVFFGMVKTFKFGGGWF